MNTFWLKIAGLAVGVVIVVIIIGSLTSPQGDSSLPEPERKSFMETKSFQTQVEEDKEKFLTKPEPVETVETKAEPEPTPAGASQTPPPAAPAPATSIIYVQPLSDIDQMEAERLLNVAVPGRSIGRLPMTGYSLMVQNCKQIIQRWPESWYAFQAKRMLAEMVEIRPDHRARYKITDEVIDLSIFYKQRKGAQAMQIKQEP